jgi:hypothetical protein
LPSPSRLAALTLLAASCCASPALAADAFEPNDTQATASGPLVDGRAYAGEISGPADKDWFAFNAGAAATVQLVASNDTPKGCFGPEYFVFDAAGTRVAKAHPASGRSETVTFAAPAAGRYVLRVTPYYIEPCAPAETKYRFVVTGGLVASLPGGGGGAGGGTPQTPGTPPVAGVPAPPVPGGSSSTAKKLRSPALKLARTTLRGRTLRASGTVARGARGGKVRVTLTRRSGRRSVVTKKTVKVATGGRWSAALTVPRSTRSVRVAVAYVADRTYRAQTARRTVRRSAS